MGTIRIFSVWWFLFIFLIKWQCWCRVLCLINWNHKKNFFLDFPMERPQCTLKGEIYDQVHGVEWLSNCDGGSHYLIIHGMLMIPFRFSIHTMRQNSFSLILIEDTLMLNLLWKQRLIKLNPFLYVLINNFNNILKRTTYHKLTYSGSLLNPLMPGGNSMCNLFVTTRHWRVNFDRFTSCF